MKGPEPVNAEIPTEDGGYQTYKAAGKLEGKKAIITGGDSGIGRAIAILFAMEGADVLIVYLPEEEQDAQETKKEVEKRGRKCYLMSTDLKKQENCKKVVDTAVSEMGTINILVNNAAYQNMINGIRELSEYIFPLVSLHQRTSNANPPPHHRDQWLKTFDTNIHPYFYMSKYALEHMKSGDTIINNASVNAYIGRPDLLDYTSSKGAIVAFTRGLSNQQISFGIRVNCVCPGPVWTPLIPSTMKSYAMDQFSGTPMGRPGQPSEIATCFVFLASQDSSFISGQSLHPNGGVVVNG
jgi:NAD(P)-dependent dehydrogenase (short-subunit alcohol dehydrogenase family)